MLLFVVRLCSKEPTSALNCHLPGRIELLFKLVCTRLYLTFLNGPVEGFRPKAELVLLIQIEMYLLYYVVTVLETICGLYKIYLVS